MLHVTRQGTTALLVLDRPPANALNHAVLTELHEALGKLASSDARALVITGKDHGPKRFFSAGLDLFEVFSYGEAQAEAFSKTFDDAFVALFSLPMPVVAALNGHAVAGGAVIAAAADFRLMSDGDAQLGLSEIKVGVPFPTSAFEIVRSAWDGPHFAELLYRGRNYRPPEALARHLVDEVVPAAELVERALELAGELGAHPRLAYASNKRALRREPLARIAAARQGGQDPVWSEWRTPEVLAIVESYRASVGKKRPEKSA
jgi:enoyl-CoA hydratase